MLDLSAEAIVHARNVWVSREAEPIGHELIRQAALGSSRQVRLMPIGLPTEII